MKWKGYPIKDDEKTVAIEINDNEDLQWLLVLKTARSAKIAVQNLSFGHMCFFSSHVQYIKQSSKTFSACKTQ